MKDTTLIIFAKAPMPGQTMTRLIPEIGVTGAVNLHRTFVLHTLQTATKTRFDSIQLWCTPSPNHPFILECTRIFDISLHTQQGADLGERMKHAFDTALQQSKSVILIGTDCPTLTVDTLENAADILFQGMDSVVAPAMDGGYVLLGLTHSSPDLFDMVPWGKDTVMQITRERLKKLGWNWHELAEHRDIDRPEDLDYLDTLKLFPGLPDVTAPKVLL